MLRGERVNAWRFRKVCAPRFPDADARGSSDGRSSKGLLRGPAPLLPAFVPAPAIGGGLGPRTRSTAPSPPTSSATAGSGSRRSKSPRAREHRPDPSRATRGRHRPPGSPAPAIAKPCGARVTSSGARRSMANPMLQQHPVTRGGRVVVEERQVHTVRAALDVSGGKVRVLVVQGDDAGGDPEAHLGHSSTDAAVDDAGGGSSPVSAYRRQRPRRLRICRLSVTMPPPARRMRRSPRCRTRSRLPPQSPTREARLRRTMGRSVRGPPLVRPRGTP